MQLTSIKLAGFKSFVDPTAVKFPGKIGAIVGPNGCGKSNIIDAVRWVMGESSAKYLRGESMADVIFNGSQERKPVGQASIELLFDNPDGKLGGEWAKYSNIAVKRIVTRDGQSSYYLNNTRCRRRDVTDLFLGTGLGPRSYAIIMQDTISRLIEAKPEELRVFLEEAAGISKYKERRRETALRIKHTRENLERLGDLREELHRQLEHLQKQARAAEHYKKLKQEQRIIKAQLHALQWHELETSLADYRVKESDAETALEAIIADIRALDTDIEHKREHYAEDNEAHHAIQAKYYQVGAKIARLEQSKQHFEERLQQYQDDYHQMTESLSYSEQQKRQDQEAIKILTNKINDLRPQWEKCQSQAEAGRKALHLAEQSIREWQQCWDEFNQHAANSIQNAHVEKARIEHIEQRMQELNSRLEALKEENTIIDFSTLENDLNKLVEQVNAAEAEQQRQQQQLEKQQTQIQEQKAKNRNLAEELDQQRDQLQSANARYASLEALQQAALGQTDAQITDWLKVNRLAAKPRLGQSIKVESGWEHAVETVLGDYLEAVCTENFTEAVAHIPGLTAGSIHLIDTDANPNAHGTPGTYGHSLAAKVTGNKVISAWLTRILIATSLPEALASVEQLAPDESIITRSGIWLGQGWLRVSLPDNKKAGKIGTLQRQQALESLRQEINERTSKVAQSQQCLAAGQEQLNQLDLERDQQVKNLRDHAQHKSELQAQLKVKQAEYRNLRKRAEQIAQERKVCSDNLIALEQSLRDAKAAWQANMAQAEKDELRREALLQQRDQCRQQWDELRRKAHDSRDQAHQLAMDYRATEAQLQASRENISRTEQQLSIMQERRYQLQAQLENADAPWDEINTELEEVLEQQLAIKKELNQAKQKLESVEADLHETTQKRHPIEGKCQQARSCLEAVRMESQALRVRQETIEETIQASESELADLIKGLPEEATLAVWEQRAERISKRIDRLGAINLAAIDECSALEERKNYLDAQNSDLEDALATLENAIRKIDRETRTRFKETYEKVNNFFAEFFPKVFAGGSAYLELTGDNLLETGVAVIARPPGKRNSTIHLLSGGEKALTALSLVFSLFQLNPAPFCLLDEVDAPLDDANVTRFCNIVKEMSKTVQFVFISHNKLAIEMADHLTGVTMNEPGVSRLVAVDIDQAVTMANAA